MTKRILPPRLRKKKANNDRKKRAVAMSNHLMKSVRDRNFKGIDGVNAMRWTRYLDQKKRPILISKNGAYFVIKKTQKGKLEKVYKPTVAFLNHPLKHVPIRSNTPLPLNLESKGNRGMKVYHPVKDLKKFSRPIYKPPKANESRLHIFHNLLNYTRAVETGGGYNATENEPYSLVEGCNYESKSNRNNPRCLFVKPSNSVKFKNIRTVANKNLPKLTMGNRRWARRHASTYMYPSELEFISVLNNWNRRNAMDKIRLLLRRKDVPPDLAKTIALNATRDYVRQFKPQKSWHKPTPPRTSPKLDRWVA